MTIDSFGQPIGEPVLGWSPPPRPGRVVLQGRYGRLEPLELRHATSLWDAYGQASDARDWTYLSHGPYTSADEFARWVASAAQSEDPLFFAITTDGGEARGVAAYLRIAPGAGSIEVGHIHLSPLLQRTPAATEAMYLMMRHVFALGYRRYEWKCDALNARSRRAAERLGFTFEGVFRQALVYKGRNRDTAWYSVVDREWPALRAAFDRWLAPENFDAAGRQRAGLHELIARARCDVVPRDSS
jgi:RimJ/RimL family protein N-acetyltransferase